MAPDVRANISLCRRRVKNGHLRIEFSISVLVSEIGHAGHSAEPLRPSSCFRYGLLRFERNDDFDAWPRQNDPTGKSLESLSSLSRKNIPLHYWRKSVAYSAVSPK
ncbi:hypothetical protein [Bradyrhizobium sp. USDA 10063]